jgi:hypothetical protein
MVELVEPESAVADEGMAKITEICPELALLRS